MCIRERTNGDWQFSTDGSAFTNFTATTESSLLLDGANANHKVRFIPDAEFNGTSSIKFRAWDKSSGDIGGTADTTNVGSTTPFSSADVTKTITVTSVNDQPDVTFGANPLNGTEDTAPISLNNFATPVSGGGTLENSQTFTFEVTNNNNSLFSSSFIDREEMTGVTNGIVIGTDYAIS